MFASHRDACILAKYSSDLVTRLDALYEREGLGDNVIAYRSLGKSNYHFAAFAQEFVRAHDPVEAMCFDVTGFFDHINHRKLKARLRALLNVLELSDDWFRVFRFVTKYRCVHKADLAAHPHFANRVKAKGAMPPIGTIEELKAQGIPIHPNPNVYGIPQGTPISASFSNLYLLGFDIELKREVEGRQALYQRYSDDILIVCKPEDANYLAALVVAKLDAEGLALSVDKTERKILSGSERADFQYLGYQLGLNDAEIRPGSLSRQWRTVRRALRKAERRAEGLAALGLNDLIYTSNLRRNLTDVGARNFLAYAKRSARELQSPAINRQVKRLRKFTLAGLARVKAIKNI